MNNYLFYKGTNYLLSNPHDKLVNQMHMAYLLRITFHAMHIGVGQCQTNQIDFCAYRVNVNVEIAQALVPDMLIPCEITTNFRAVPLTNAWPWCFIGD